VTLCETYLGLRHGPLSYLREDTVTVCFVSADEQSRRYEGDLLEELREKRLGRLVGIVPEGTSWDVFDVVVPALAPDLPESLRAPFEIVFAQLLGYHLEPALLVWIQTPESRWRYQSGRTGRAHSSLGSA
jgi:tagatose-6-phosphate ketose/aldose isomerase